jgi:hypothetical protein
MSKPARTLRRRAPRASSVAMSALVVTFAACSGPSAPEVTSSTGPHRPTPGATFTGTIFVRTATSGVIRSFTERVANVASCAAAARIGDANGTFRVPSPPLPGPAAEIEIAGFHGPGTYTPGMLRHDRADSILLVGKAGTSQYVITSPALSRAPGKEMLFLLKDGSGQLDYTGAHLDGRATDPQVAGLIEWSCRS